MIQSVWRRLQLSITQFFQDSLSKTRLSPASYELLPVTSDPKPTMKQSNGRRNGVVLLLALILLVISGVSAGVVLKSAHTTGK